ncbi:MAG TPA: hypothetical protein PKC43_00895 [Phycisphaerales bacterium]|nr:hypothetical protein [Phycisphaerales bacterium]HMP35983.1 hypothetical protein [Phycisphaerales bacterium]
MELHQDFRELLERFNVERVEYVVVGGYALAAHGAPRYTGDFDIYIRPTAENADRVLAALRAFGFGSLDLTRSDFDHPGQVVQLGFEPWRVDLLTQIAGVSWEEAAGEAITVSWGVDFPVIGRAALIRNKRATGRPQDTVDAQRLESQPRASPAPERFRHDAG